MTATSAVLYPTISSRGLIAVLIADDELGIERLLSQLLHGYGFAPLRTPSVGDVLDVAEHCRVAAFLLDLDLCSGQGGLLVLRWLRAHPQYAHTPVAILTGSRDLSNNDEAMIRRHRAHIYRKGQPLHVLLGDLILDRHSHPSARD